MSTALLFPNSVRWCTDYLRPRLQANGYPSVRVADTYKGDDVEVWVQRDGGGELDVVRDEPRLRINVFHKSATSAEVDALADMVVAIMRAAPGNGPVKRVKKTSGPSPIPDTLPRRYLLFELVTKGSPLTLS